MSRFIFSIDGDAHLSENEFFPDGVPDEIGLDEITNEIEDVSHTDLMMDWNLIDSLTVTLTDTETGAQWRSYGHGFELVRTRKLLKGEQRLFDDG